MPVTLVEPQNAMPNEPTERPPILPVVQSEIKLSTPSIGRRRTGRPAPATRTFRCRRYTLSTAGTPRTADRLSKPVHPRMADKLDKASNPRPAENTIETASLLTVESVNKSVGLRRDRWSPSKKERRRTGRYREVQFRQCAAPRVATPTVRAATTKNAKDAALPHRVLVPVRNPSFVVQVGRGRAREREEPSSASSPPSLLRLNTTWKVTTTVAVAPVRLRRRSTGIRRRRSTRGTVRPTTPATRLSSTNATRLSSTFSNRASANASAGAVTWEVPATTTPSLRLLPITADLAQPPRTTQAPSKRVLPPFLLTNALAKALQPTAAKDPPTPLATDPGSPFTPTPQVKCTTSRTSVLPS